MSFVYHSVLDDPHILTLKSLTVSLSLSLSIEMSSDSDDTLLGSGSFAKVYRARNTKNGKLVALKVMYKNLLRKQFVMKSRYNPEDDDDDPIPITQRHTMLEAVQIELGIMMRIRSVHTIRLWFVIDDPQKDSLYLSLEYSPYGQVMDFDGKLLQYIPNRKIWSQSSFSSKDKWITTNTQVPQPWWYSKYVSKKGDQEDSVRENVERFRVCHVVLVEHVFTLKILANS